MRGLRKRGSVWWYRITKAGQTHEGSLQTGERRVALERLEAIRREITGERFGERHRTFDDAARRFVAEHFETLKPRTRDRYMTSLSALTPMFAGLRLGDIGSAKLDEYERARRSVVTTSTIRRDLLCLSIMMTLAEEWEWIDRNPVLPFLRARGKRGLTEAAPRTRYLTIEEEARIIANADAHHRPAIMLAIDTGLRRGELHELTWGDVDLGAGRIIVRAEHAKSGVARLVPLLDRARGVLELLGPGAPDQHVIRPTDARRYIARSKALLVALQAAAKAAGLSDLVWHDLRRTCGCRLLQVYGLSMEKVSAWLGHSDVRVTAARYAFLRIDDLQRSVETVEERRRLN